MDNQTLREQFDDVAHDAKWSVDRQINVLLEFLEDYDLHGRFLAYAAQEGRAGEGDDQPSLFPLHVVGTDSR
jgi:hypothetical protein